MLNPPTHPALQGPACRGEHICTAVARPLRTPNNAQAMPALDRRSGIVCKAPGGRSLKADGVQAAVVHGSPMAAGGDPTPVDGSLFPG